MANFTEKNTTFQRVD